MNAKKSLKFRFMFLNLLAISSILLSSCGEVSSTEAPASEEAPSTEEASATEAPVSDNPIVGTWQDSNGTYTYTEDGKLLVNDEDSGQTYEYADGSLTENYADGSTRTYTVTFDEVGMTQVAEDDGSEYTLIRVGGDTATATEAPAESAAPSVDENGVDTGFRPEVNGFSIPNYGDVGQTLSGETFSVVNLTSAEMRRMFGDEVCAAPADSDGNCTLTPPASQWMDQQNASMNGGHCEGFAVLSQLIYGGEVDPNQFGAARTFDLQVQDNEALQREIAYWFTTQATTWGLQQILAPADAIGYLEKEYASNTNNIFRLGIFKEDGTGGHAITAYGVQNQGDGVYWVMVYDNNYPGQERHMTVDVNANTWEYEASINPSVAPDVYRGSPQNPLMIARNEPRLNTFACDFCNGGGGANKGGGKFAAPSVQFNEIFTEGYVNVELQDEKGRMIGFDADGKFVNEIPEAKIQSTFNDPLSEVNPTIKMPTGMDFTAFLWGDEKAAEIPASLVMIGKGFYVGIDGLEMTPDQEDQLFVDGAGDAINYTTDSETTPAIIVGIEKPGADFELLLQADKISKGTDVSVVFDQKEDIFAFQTTSDAPAQFYISITRIDANGEEETFDTGDTPIEIESEKFMYFYFGKWSGQGSDLEIGYDENGNGEIEDEEVTNMADAE